MLATKVIGFQRCSRVQLYRTDPPTVQEGQLPTTHLNKESIITACEASLRRLQTNYIDVYQIYWPDRYIPCFGSIFRYYHGLFLPVDYYRGNIIPMNSIIIDVVKRRAKI